MTKKGPADRPCIASGVAVIIPAGNPLPCPKCLAWQRNGVVIFRSGDGSVLKRCASNKSADQFGCQYDIQELAIAGVDGTENGGVEQYFGTARGTAFLISLEVHCNFFGLTF
ncbi:MAG: hypothetical protein JWR22_4042 [Herminiimonas sp.]|nr:hypothetical protein [Herminiimonas sp.]